MRVSAAIERLLAADGCSSSAMQTGLTSPELNPNSSRLATRLALSIACGLRELPRFRRFCLNPTTAPTSGLIASGSAPPGAFIVPPPGATGPITTRPEEPGDTAIPAPPVNEPSLLDQAADLANRGRFDDAIAACERHIRLKSCSPPAYYLMGMICQAAGNRVRAEDCFHKTVYLDPMHDEALLALALLAERAW